MGVNIGWSRGIGSSGLSGKIAFISARNERVNGSLAQIDRKEEARELFEEMLRSRTRLGLLSEDLDVRTGQLWGNFPQTYSMAGIINAAVRLSRPWEEALRAP